VQSCLLQDLTGGNVLLTSFAGNPHGFSAKVTDFGLARPQDVRVRSAPGCYGTVTHMAPETIRAGVLDYPCDVYAFGVLCWEMITGGRQGLCLSWVDRLMGLHKHAGESSAMITCSVLLCSIIAKRSLCFLGWTCTLLHHLTMRCMCLMLFLNLCLQAAGRGLTLVPSKMVTGITFQLLSVFNNVSVRLQAAERGLACRS
jgi:serine/threonine protein kinase